MRLVTVFLKVWSLYNGLSESFANIMQLSFCIQTIYSTLVKIFLRVVKEGRCLLIWIYLCFVYDYTGAGGIGRENWG